MSCTHAHAHHHLRKAFCTVRLLPCHTLFTGKKKALLKFSPFKAANKIWFCVLSIHIIACSKLEKIWTYTRDTLAKHKGHQWPLSSFTNWSLQLVLPAPSTPAVGYNTLHSKHASYHPLENIVGVFSDSHLNTQERSAHRSVTVSFTKFITFIFARSPEKQVTWAVTAKASSA